MFSYLDANDIDNFENKIKGLRSITGMTKDERAQLSKKEYNELINNCVFKITKDNVHLYYEFMSDEDLDLNRRILRNVFYERKILVLKSLGFKNSYNDEEKSQWKHSPLKKHHGQSFFGIKDILKPIDEYIEEIKASDEYKKYISDIKG